MQKRPSCPLYNGFLGGLESGLAALSKSTSSKPISAKLVMPFSGPFSSSHAMHFRIGDLATGWSVYGTSIEESRHPGTIGVPFPSIAN